MTQKEQIIEQIKENVLDILALYDYNNIKVEIHANGNRKSVTLSITEFIV